MARLIPGFYYDEEKHKYFKITPNHQAPQGAKYSQEAMAQAVRAKQRKDNMEALPCLRIQEAAIMLHPLGGSLGLQRQSGLRAAGLGGLMEAWASGLVRRPYFPHFLELEPKPHIQQFIVDDATDSFFYTTFTMDGRPHLVRYAFIPHRKPCWKIKIMG